MFFFIFILLMLFLLVISARGQETESALSGGQFAITKTVIAGGGGDLRQNQTNLNNTVGQTVAGRQSSGGNFTLYSGFWTPDVFAPTAATAVVGGRIQTPDGRGIRSVRVTITYPNGQTQTTLSASFGYYRFMEIPVGATYVISVAAKNYVFARPAQVCAILEDTQDINFISDNLP